MKFSLVIPVYNEASRLENTLKEILSSTEKMENDYEIILVEDGSTDETDKIAERLAEENSVVKFIHNEVRLGKGGAIKRGIEAASSGIIVTLDSDLSMNLSFLKNLVDSVEQGCDICIASRFVKGKIVKRSISREVASRAYNFMVRTLFNSKIQDHQSGFKSFNSEKIKELIKNVQNNGWIFDTELLVRAQKMGMNIKEIPVVWVEDKEGSFNLRKDSISMGIELLKFWRKERKNLNL